MMMERVSPRKSEQKYHWNNNCLSSSGLLAFEMMIQTKNSCKNKKYILCRFKKVSKGIYYLIGSPPPLPNPHRFSSNPILDSLDKY